MKGLGEVDVLMTDPGASVHHVAGSELSWRNVSPARVLAQNCPFGGVCLNGHYMFVLGLS